MQAKHDEAAGVLTIGARTILAREAYFSNLSQIPERRARMELGALAARLNRFADFARKLAEEAPGFDAAAELERFTAKHVKLTRLFWARESRCASWFVTGPARFPVARNAKRMASSDNARDLITEHERNARKACERRAFPYGRPDGPIRSDNPDALALLRQRIADAEATHAQRLAANAAARKAGKPGPYTYELSYGRAEIKRLSDRVRIIEREKSKPADAPSERTEGGITIRENVDAMRLQLVFPGKPDHATRQALKSSGFRWAPTEGAWQRQLNNASREAARRVLSQIATVSA